MFQSYKSLEGELDSDPLHEIDAGPEGAEGHRPAEADSSPQDGRAADGSQLGIHVPVAQLRSFLEKIPSFKNKEKIE